VQNRKLKGYDRQNSRCYYY